MTKGTKVLAAISVAALVGIGVAVLALGSAERDGGDPATRSVEDESSEPRGALDAPSSEGATVLGATAGTRPEVVVWKSPTCGCCEGWVEYLEEEGFAVTAHDTDDMDAVKTRLGLVDPALESCHTATVGSYVVEGHVPASDIERLLVERPDVVGISAPGMPMQSPGMGSREPKGYDVVSFDADGGTALFSRH